ncbi:MAG: hypothetical protein IPM07_07630 [Anaerolineales bacterium]|nr:hypothetical protein [Anaerolineales bacterium]
MSAFPPGAGKRAERPGAAPFVPFHALAEETWSAASLTHVEDNLSFEPLFGADEGGQDEAGRRRWTWIGAALVFASVFLCGSMVASYTGWQWIARNLPARAANGRVDTVSPADATPAIYVVQTATPEPAQAGEPGVVGPTAPIIVLPPGAGGAESAAPAFPAAVTPTPITLQPPLAAAIAGDGAGEGEPAEAGVEPPLLNVDAPIPTRRPTPIFDLPTSTPLVDALPSPTPAPTPTPLGTPFVIFAADNPALKEGRCTMVRWNVKNVREVYYENLPMSGLGEREECIEDESEVYTLLVVLGDGSSQIYTTTVSYLPPTPTLTPTPSFTPPPELTATWTPQPPTATPAPVVNYGVALTLNGSAELTCAAGQTCEAGLLVTNAGDAIDALIVTLVQGGAFPSQLCRPDGVCAGNDLSIVNVRARQHGLCIAAHQRACRRGQRPAHGLWADRGQRRLRTHGSIAASGRRRDYAVT